MVEHVISLCARTPRPGHTLAYALPLLLLTGILVFLAGPVYGAQVTIAWDANTDPEVTGYRLYHGTASGQYASLSDVSNQTACTLGGLEAGTTYFFAATAYDSQGNQSS